MPWLKKVNLLHMLRMLNVAYERVVLFDALSDASDAAA